MPGDEWRKRLSDAIEKSGQTPRAVSLTAGCSAGYLHGILKEGKEPGLERLRRIADVLHVSLAYIILGIELTLTQERLLLLLSGLPDDQKELLLKMAESLHRGTDKI